ncbi:RNA degradosome polyphosphate kinase [Pseudogracilibacillus auburnensis]|uniref:RNA degradosome polyphosphate kinase n=1 Tax=Pseudogracilibacillus auburnensis TaxID=1494959 RepID=UPI001A973CD1|nr:RNA degradosome polyphosphate kinase [Pseudogracilibacillus auburnensis]MBO1003905.1 RNA degradosome polyphosphate kinase [Pseudogracilibacillus auburnensis]
MVEAKKPFEKKDLSHPEYYNNRELSWLAFNERVLEEVSDSQNPLLEKMKFISIFSSNLDEFFMVRVAGLKDQVKSGFNNPENKAGLTPRQQLDAIGEKTQQLVKKQYEQWNDLILSNLVTENIHLKQMDELSNKQLHYLTDYFDNEVHPVLTPLAVDAYRPFPMVLNKSLNLAVLLEKYEQEHHEKMDRMAFVQVPSVLERVITIPAEEESYEYVLLENVIEFFAERLFRGYKIKATCLFRITRNADLTIHEEGARDFLSEIEKELKKRKWGGVVRLEVRGEHVHKKILNYLAAELDIEQGEVYAVNGPIDFTFLFSFVNTLQDFREELIHETIIPQRPLDLRANEDIFEKALQQDLLFHHPYESFEPIVEFISRAAVDPAVLAIKQTLYRVSGESPIIKALERAAENGKQVTVLVELKARFDEEQNVHWAKALEKAGCHVIYGIHNLKTHSKITLVVRKRNGKIERFVHLGTGNYNDQTAKLYTDFGFITSRKKFGVDASNFFNYLSGYTEKPEYHHLSVSPYEIQSKFIELIDAEIESHNLHGNGHIILKMNSFTDKRLIMKMYEASCAGVKIDCIVRGICCLRPGIPGVSENIRVISIVGRFLEHSRIYYFHNNGDERVFLSSADMMTRNMVRRVEILFPIYHGMLQERLIHFLKLQLSDNVKARYQDQEGHYHYVEKNPMGRIIDSQLECLQNAHPLRSRMDELLQSLEEVAADLEEEELEKEQES